MDSKFAVEFCDATITEIETLEAMGAWEIVDKTDEMNMHPETTRRPAHFVDIDIAKGNIRRAAMKNFVASQQYHPDYKYNNRFSRYIDILRLVA